MRTVDKLRRPDRVVRARAREDAAPPDLNDDRTVIRRSMTGRGATAGTYRQIRNLR